MEAVPLPLWEIQDAKTQVRMRCPRCRHQGTFEVIVPHDVSNGQDIRNNLKFGQRRCPNPECHAHAFVVFDGFGKIVASYPPEAVDFDTTNLPESVLASLSEGIECFAIGCNRAAALMIRRTLEEVCADRGAVGVNLHDRLKALGTKVILPPELLQGLDALRLLGNDAGHLEARTYDEIGRDEIQLALDIAKEVLKAVYQYGSLVARLEAMKKETPGREG